MKAMTVNEPATRATEFSPGWSERSKAEPWVRHNKESIARFSGRQKVFRDNCRPLKQATDLLFRRYPGLRCACPGPNSATGYAGSLNGSITKRLIQLGFSIHLRAISEGGY